MQCMIDISWFWWEWLLLWRTVYQVKNAGSCYTKQTEAPVHRHSINQGRSLRHACNQCCWLLQL